MPELEPPEQHVVNAAAGWLELGNPGEALSELNSLPEAHRHNPDVLELRWRILAALTNWPAALEVATQLLESHPDDPAGWIHRSFSLHELKRTREAWENLVAASKRFPLVPVIAYNLACYACQLQRPTIALQWLGKAARLLGRERVKDLARQDPDLAPLQADIEAL